jgi:hypothetical protein
MKRKAREDTPKDLDSTGNIKLDLTNEQRAAFGAAALSYNVLEDQIDALIFVILQCPEWLSAEVSSRIHGLDGKTAIIQKAIEHIDIATRDKKTLTNAVAAFGDFKKTRDTMIHARVVNAFLGVGRGTKARGKSAFEILLSAAALDSFYDHIVALQRVLSSGGALLNSAIALKQCAANDPNKLQLEEALRVRVVQFRESHSHRLSLKPLPKFPDEEELRQEANRLREMQITMRMGYPRPGAIYQPDNTWQMMYRRNNALLDTYFPPGGAGKKD